MCLITLKREWLKVFVVFNQPCMMVAEYYSRDPMQPKKEINLIETSLFRL